MKPDFSRWWREDDTLVKWLARHVFERPDQLAIISGEQRLTWSQLEQRVLRAAQGLKEHHIGRGCRLGKAAR